jgi:hypothetical protein
MNCHNEQLAKKVVEVFKNNISADARAHISEAEFDELAQIVREALSLEMTEAVEMVAELEKRMKARTDQPDLGL